MKGFILGILLVFVFASMLIGQRIYEVDKELNITRDIYNLTKNINVNFSCPDFKNNFSQYSKVDLPTINQKRINNLICKFADFLTYTGIEFIKYSIEFGYYHPQYDFQFYVKLVIVWMLAVLLVPMIVPLIALFYLMGWIIYKIFIWRKKKHDNVLQKPIK